MTVIIKESALTTTGSVSEYNGRPFDGVALTILEGVVTEKVRYQTGKQIGEYINPYFPYDKNALHIESSCFDDEYDEPFEYRGKIFYGTAYFFKGDQCISEVQCDSGWIMSEVKYTDIGKITELLIVDGELNDEFSQKYSWFDGGTIRSFQVQDKRDFGILLSFLEDGNVKFICIDQNYFAQIKSFKEKIEFNLFDEKSFTLNLKAADKLYLMGLDIDDDVFANLLANDGLNNTTELDFSNTSLTIESIQQLASVKSITKLDIDSDIIDLKDMQNFKSKKPDCDVVFNSWEITA